MPRPPKLVHIAILLAIVLVSSACGVSAAASTTPTLTPPSTYTPYPVPTYTPYPVPTLTPGPTSTPTPEWVAYTFQLADSRTYKMDMPGVFHCGAASAPPGHLVVPCNYIHYFGSYPLPANHPTVEELDIMVDASIVTDQTMRGCNGTPVTVGLGITGYQAYSTNDTCDGSEPPAVRVLWKTQGACYEMTANSYYSGPEDFNTRYGAIWQHILASFVPPAPPASGDTTCS